MSLHDVLSQQSVDRPTSTLELLVNVVKLGASPLCRTRQQHLPHLPNVQGGAMIPIRRRRCNLVRHLRSLLFNRVTWEFVKSGCGSCVSIDRERGKCVAVKEFVSGCHEQCSYTHNSAHMRTCAECRFHQSCADVCGVFMRALASEKPVAEV